MANIRLDDRATNALTWIVSMLRANTVPFLITGGLAAKVYGSLRQLADIDISVPEKSLSVLFADVQPYVTFGPARFKDDSWDLSLMTLNFNGQEIDLGSNEAYIFDKDSQIWTTVVDDLNLSEIHEIAGMKLPVIPKQSLIDYKSKLRRMCDLEDIDSIQ